jgi:hypothetical protein
MMVSPVSFFLLISSRIFDSFIMLDVLAEKQSAATTEKRCTTPDAYVIAVYLIKVVVFFIFY